jgi:biotin-(acetyl-CoA carboxylase) ligase
VDFPEELKGIAATVGDVNGMENEIIAHIVSELLRLSDDPVSREYMKGYRKRFMLRDEYVTLFSCGEAIGEGRVLDVTDDGGLIFLRDGKTEPEVIHSGEITVRRRG